MRHPTHTDRKALASLIAGALCIGFAPIFVRLVDVGYTAAAFWRVAALGGAIVLAGIVVCRVTTMKT